MNWLVVRTMNKVLIVLLVAVGTLGLVGTVGYAEMVWLHYPGNGNMMNCSGSSGGMMGGMMGECRTSSSGTSASGDTITISNYSFNPQTLTVSVGTTVTWTNNDNVAHSVVSGTPGQPSALFQSSLLSNRQSFNYTFENPGSYPYHCGPHPYMTGTVVVK